MVARPAQRLGPTWASGGGRAHFRSAQGARAQGARWGGIFKPLFSLAHRGLRCFRCARLDYLWVVTALQHTSPTALQPYITAHQHSYGCNTAHSAHSAAAHAVASLFPHFQLIYYAIRLIYHHGMYIIILCHINVINIGVGGRPTAYDIPAHKLGGGPV